MNMHRWLGAWCTVTCIAGLGCWCADPAVAEKADPPAFPSLRLPKDAPVAASPDQVFRAVAGMALDPWKPAVNEEKARGPAAELYSKIGPAVVVVRAGNGHGTGAVIDPAGWIITNHHVIADGTLDPATGARQATIYFGKIDGEFMRLIDDGIPALVYKSSPEKDLALLKLSRLPAGVKELPSIELAKEAPRPGSDCVSIGHPGAGTLWTVRSGEVSGVGNWPKEMTDIAAAMLAATAKEKEKLAELLANSPQRKVLISSCGVNHGDSGGPLVNTQGKLIAVTFAMPKADNRGTLRLSYHVHLDEVKSFLADRPKAPTMQVPDPWPPGVLGALLDLDEDGIPETLVFATERGQDFSGLMLDLKQESDRKLRVEELADPQRRSGWRFQFAFHRLPKWRAFYSTAGDGKIDLIMTDNKGTGSVDEVLRLEKGSWVREELRGRKLIDPALIHDKTMRDRFVKVFKRLEK